MSLHVDLSGPVATLIIDRPDRHNAFSSEMWSELQDLLASLVHDPTTRVLVLRSSTDRVFSAGADVEELRKAVEDPDGAGRGLAVIRSAFESLIAFPKPTVAVIRGACHGGGVGLAVCCDIRLADTTAVFSIPPARLGLLYPHPALRRLVWMLGPGQAKRLLFTARSFDAFEAERIGFLDELVEPEELEPAATRLTSEIAANSATAIASMKHIVALTECLAPDAEAVADRLEREALAGPDHAEGVAAFLEKRPPRF